MQPASGHLPSTFVYHRAGFSITAERSKLVQFVSPSYYSAGATLFAPGGRIEGVSSWGDLKGKTLSVLQGAYFLDAAPSTPALQNVTLIEAPTAEGALPVGRGTRRHAAWQPLNCRCKKSCVHPAAMHAEASELVLNGTAIAYME